MKQNWKPCRGAWTHQILVCNHLWQPIIKASPKIQNTCSFFYRNVPACDRGRDRGWVNDMDEAKRRKSKWIFHFLPDLTSPKASRAHKQQTLSLHLCIFLNQCFSNSLDYLHEGHLREGSSWLKCHLLGSVAQLLSCVRLFATLWTAAHQASLSFTISQSLLIFMPIESVMLSNHLILSCPLLLLPSIFPDLWNLSHSVGWSPGITRWFLCTKAWRLFKQTQWVVY